MEARSRIRLGEGRVVAALAVWLVAVASGGPAHGAEGLEVSTREVRSYEVPSGFALEDRIVASTDDGETLIANTTGEGSEATCLVVLVSGESAAAYPYRHGPEGTRCVGAIVHPDGGFVLRATRAQAASGQAAGFTVRVDRQGRERWLVRDSRVAGSDEFGGEYKQPDARLAYSPSSEFLLTVTLGEISPGFGPARDISHVSILDGGQMSIPAKRLGSSAGYGRIGAVAALESSGRFLLHLYEPDAVGAEFVVYDGRQSVGSYRPLEAAWQERVVRGMRHGPDANLYLLWSEGVEADGPTRIAVADEQGGEVWSESYPATVPRPDGAPPVATPSDAGVDGGVADDELDLGPPRGIWVGRDYVIISYTGRTTYFRLLEANSGREMAVIPASQLTGLQRLNVLRGQRGRLKLLAFDRASSRFRELRIEVASGGPTAGDAGWSDATGSEASRAGGSQQGGCSTSGRPLSPVPIALVALAAGWAAARCRR